MTSNNFDDIYQRTTFKNSNCLVKTVSFGAMALVLSSLAGVLKAYAQEDQTFDAASVFFELNDTDGDLGLQAFVDGEPWSLLIIEDEDDGKLFTVRASRSLAQQGLNEIFFESSEPNFDELPADEFLARFPEGTYDVEANKLDGGELESEVQVTHLLPAPPANLAANGQATPLDCEVEAPPSVGTPVTISWDAVTLSHPTIGRVNEPIDVNQYEVTVEIEDLPNAEFTIKLGPDQTSVDVPAQLLALGDEFKLGVAAREESGNRTVIESCFAK